MSEVRETLKPAYFDAIYTADAGSVEVRDQPI